MVLDRRRRIDQNKRLEVTGWKKKESNIGRMQRSAANCPPLSWTGSVISLFWQQKTDNLSAYVVILDLECIHMWQAVNHSLCKANICLWSTLSNSLSVMSFLSIMYALHVHVYLYYMYVIHCWNGCTVMLKKLKQCLSWNYNHISI